MLRILAISLLIAASALGATVRLYLKDGTYQMAREYKVQEDRVRFYSTERGNWEEIPLDLVDLKRTEREVKEREESRKEEAALFDAEEKVERQQKREAARVPQGMGVYLVDGDNLKELKLAESKVVSNKRRSILKAISPIPVVAGKSTVELDGTQSATVVGSNLPEFYIRLSAEQRFGIVKLSPEKKTRIVERVTVVPVTNEMVEEPEMVETFQKQVGDGVYKIWPSKPLEPGEYAVVEFTPGQMNIQVWDFAYRK